MIRVASLISSGTEILFGLGMEDYVVAVGHECDYPPQAHDKPRVTWSSVDAAAGSGTIDSQVKDLSASGAPLYEFDRAALAELRPNVIVTQAQCDVCAVRYEDVVQFVQAEPALSQTQVVALNPQSLNDVLADIQHLGRVLNVEDRADRYVQGLRSRIEGVRERTSRIASSQRPRVACIEWIEPLMLAANWTPELIEIAGGRCWPAERGHSIYNSWTDVVRFDPSVVIVAPCGFDLDRTLHEAQQLLKWDGFSELSAVITDRVYALDGNAYLNRSGPRLVDSVEILAHLFHPEHFPAACEQAWTKLRNA